MTNEEKTKEIIKMSNTKQVYDIVDFSSLEVALREDLMAMAQWKDEQLEAEKQALIDKACEWLLANVSKHLHGNYTFLKGLMLEEFQQAMKGGNNE